MISSTRIFKFGAPVRLAAAAVLGVAGLVGCSSDSNDASTIAVVSGNTQTGVVGGPLTSAFVVKVTDKDGDPVQGAIVSFTTTGGASLQSSTATTDASGIARDSLTLLSNTAGSGTVTASVNGVSTNVTFNFTATPAAPATVVVVSGDNQSGAVGSALAAPLIVTVKDQFGNAITGATIDWTTTAGSIAGSPQSVTDATGKSQATVQLPAAVGPITVTATLSGTQLAATFTETATGGSVASAIAVVSGDIQTGTVAGTLVTPLVVKVTDAAGLPVSGATVTFTASGGATLRTATVTTDASGLASDSLMVLGTTSGSGTVTAAVNGVATNAVFNFVANPGPAAQLTIVSGNNQTATAGTALAAPMVVKVTDQFGNVVTNATVTWTTSAGTLAGNPQTVTDATGQASAAVQLPAAIGPITVTATLQGTAATAVFTETAM